MDEYDCDWLPCAGWQAADDAFDDDWLAWVGDTLMAIGFLAVLASIWVWVRKRL